MADLGGAPEAPPLRTTISSISEGFLENITKILGRRPILKVLDPPLINIILDTAGPVFDFILSFRNSYFMLQTIRTLFVEIHLFTEWKEKVTVHTGH